MSDNQTLELQIKSESDQAILSLNNLIGVLTNIEHSVSNIDGKLIRSRSTINQTTTSLKQMQNQTSHTSSALSKLQSVLTFVGIRRVFQTLNNWMQDAIDYTEQLNLFNVVFGNIKKNGVETFSKLGLEATKYQNQLNEGFGTNKTETLYMQGMFNSMGKSAGIPEQYSALMSKTMTNLTYDIASLFNKNEKVVSEALRAGVYAGQTKPLRSFGIDVTQNTMKPLLESLGINDRTVSELSYAEREILRYIATLRQAKVAMGDMANTIESPSNQLKVFRQQLTEAKIALTGLFINAFAKILPYANAILMVIKEVSKAIANLFGIKLTDYNTSIASNLGDYSDGIDNVSDSAGKAKGKIKELKREILGFDQIHNIDEPKNNDSGSSGTVVSGGIDQRLLDAIKGYDNGLDKVRMKAAEIRDKIMEWLGFLKVIDPITGEIGFKFANYNSTLYKVVQSLKRIYDEGKKVIKGVFEIIAKDFNNGLFGKFIVKGLNLIGDALEYVAKHKSAQNLIAKLLELLVGFKVVKTIINPIIKLFGFSGLTTLGGTIKALYQPTSALFGMMITGLKSSHSSISSGINSWREQMGIIDSTTGKVNGFSGAMNGAKVAVTGLITGAMGLYTVNQSIKSIVSDGADLLNVLGLVGGSIQTIASGVQIGAIFGPWGAVIGGATGALITLITAIDSYSSANDKLSNNIKEVNKTVSDYENTMKELASSREKYLSKGMTEISHYEDLYRELKLIVDENGKVKEGYEARANYIVTTLSNALGLEISIVDGQIDKYSELESSIQKVIEKKKAQLLLEAHEADYVTALKEKTSLQKNYSKALDDTKEAQDKYNLWLQKASEFYHISIQDLEDYANGQLKITDTSGELRRTLTLLSQDGNQFGSMIRYSKEKLDEALESEKKAGKVLSDNQKIIYDYNTATQYLAEENYKAMYKIYDDTVNFNSKTTESNNNKYEKNKNSALEYLDYLKQNKKKYNEEFIASEEDRINRQITEWDKERKEANKQIELTNQVKVQKTLEGVNKQLDTIKGKKYEFKQASSGNMQLYVDGIETGNEVSEKTMKKIVNGTIKQIKTGDMDAKEAGKYLVDSVSLGISKKQNPKIKVDVDTSNASSNMDSFINSLNRKLGFNLNFTRKEKGGAFYQGNWHDIKQYANGGIPTHGTMFVAGERGSEIVGNINGRTEVLNQSQIASSIYSAVVSAMSQVQNSASQIDVFVHTDEGVIVDRINQTTKQTGICPIKII